MQVATSHSFVSSPQDLTSPCFPFPNAASIFDQNHISDLLESFQAKSSTQDDHSLHSDSSESTYDALYNYAVVTEPPTVTLNPAWTLPRKAMVEDTVHSTTLNVPLELQSHFGSLSPPDSSLHVSPQMSSLPITPDMQALVPDVSLTEPSLDFIPQLDTFASPMSAPAQSFQFASLDIASEPLFGPAQRHRTVSRPFPYTALSRPIARELMVNKCFQSPSQVDYLAPANPEVFGRRRSVSLSHVPPPSLMSESYPQCARQSSQSLLAPFQQQSAQSPQREGSPGKDRRASAAKRKVTMQSVIAEARLPPSPSPPAARKTSGPASNTLCSITSNPFTAANPTLESALEALQNVDAYVQSLINAKGPEAADLTVVSSAHLHLLRDLKCRLKSTSGASA